ncbi:hypothetical protein ACM46_16180 [Chryseobacterium angstadtii]|uniref:Lipoprotein n=1 Tax=Chryseobacterium angstadtii TaxID=558151 RepID=A0A0J7I5B0_9FLAO|nr:hypothetical protein [Chryseobacterium angstadtii]KMQ61547.1 hypothetical protein ACM46_16180 [Chryseobacterium angstadtii]
MKKIVLILSVLFLFSCKNDKDKTAIHVSVSKNEAPSKQDTVPAKNETDLINQIKKDYAALHAELESKKLSPAGFQYNCNEEPLGEVTFYSDQGEIKVIEHSYAEHSHFSASERYFIKNGKPFFIVKQETEWSFDGGTPEKPVTKDDIIETRIYLNDDRAVQCLEKKYTIRSDRKDPSASDKVPGKKIQCNTEELLKTYQSLLKHRDQRGEIKCL